MFPDRSGGHLSLGSVAESSTVAASTTVKKSMFPDWSGGHISSGSVAEDPHVAVSTTVKNQYSQIGLAAT